MCDNNEPSTLFVSVPRVKKFEGKCVEWKLRVRVRLNGCTNTIRL